MRPKSTDYNPQSKISSMQKTSKVYSYRIQNEISPGIYLKKNLMLPDAPGM